MSKRFGRNQKRKLKELVLSLQFENTQINNDIKSLKSELKEKRYTISKICNDLREVCHNISILETEESNGPTYEYPLRIANYNQVQAINTEPMLFVRVACEKYNDELSRMATLIFRVRVMRGFEYHTIGESCLNITEEAFRNQGIKTEDIARMLSDHINSKRLDILK